MPLDVGFSLSAQINAAPSGSEAAAVPSQPHLRGSDTPVGLGEASCARRLWLFTVCAEVRVQQSHKYMLLNLRSVLFHQSPEILVFSTFLPRFIVVF